MLKRTTRTPDTATSATNGVMANSTAPTKPNRNVENAVKIIQKRNAQQSNSAAPTASNNTLPWTTTYQDTERGR